MHKIKPILIFIFIGIIIIGIKFLEKGTGVLQEYIYTYFSNHIQNSQDTFNLGWLITYLTGNPTAVIQTALSFLNNNLISENSFSSMIVGTRLGSTGMITIIALIYYKYKEKKHNIFSFIFALYTIFALLGGMTLFFHKEVFLIHHFQELAIILNSYSQEITQYLPNSLISKESLLSNININPALSYVLGLAFISFAFSSLDKLYIHSKKITPRNPFFKKITNHVQRPWSSYFLGMFTSILLLGNITPIIISLPIFIHYKYKKYFGIDPHHSKVYYNMLFPYLIGAFTGGLSDTYFIARVANNNTMLTISLSLICSAILSSIILMFLSKFFFPYAKKAAVHFKRNHNELLIIIGIIVLIPFVRFFG